MAFKGYGRATGVVWRFLKSKGIVRQGTMIASVQEIAAKISEYRRSPIPAGKRPMKELIMEFAAEVEGVSPPPRQRRHREKITPSVCSKERFSSTQYVNPQRSLSPAVDFYWSEEWRRVRYLALRKGRGACELCGAAPSPGKPLHIDHIKPRSKYPELELELSNLQVLCADCNLGKSNIDEIDWRRN
jgi:5-methylcytosine-specific restriction endonuclease McrA